MMNFYQLDNKTKNIQVINKILNNINSQKGEISLLFSMMYQFMVLEDTQFNQELKKEFEKMIEEKAFIFKECNRILSYLGVKVFSYDGKNNFLLNGGINQEIIPKKFLEKDLELQKKLILNYQLILKSIDTLKLKCKFKKIIELSLKHKKTFETLLQKC